MKEEINPIEEAIKIDMVAFYLEEVTKADFIKHIEDLKRRYADKGAIEQAINELQKLL